MFLCPTMDDEGPMMVTESMMCGTPVVMFKVGIAGDLIREGESGYAVPAGDAVALARALSLVLAWPVTTTMREVMHDLASHLQSPHQVAPRIEDAMQNLIAVDNYRRH